MEAKEKRNIFTGGVILITLGVLILLHNMNIYGLAKSWPILLIVISVGTLTQRLKDFGGWFIGVSGLIFLFVNNWGYELHSIAIYLVPLLLIFFGVSILIKKYKKKQQP